MRFRRILTAMVAVSSTSSERGETDWVQTGSRRSVCRRPVQPRGGRTGTALHSARPGGVLRTHTPAPHREAYAVTASGVGGPDREGVLHDLALRHVDGVVEDGHAGGLEAGPGEAHPQLRTGQAALDDATDGRGPEQLEERSGALDDRRRVERDAELGGHGGPQARAAVAVAGAAGS